MVEGRTHYASQFLPLASGSFLSSHLAILVSQRPGSRQQDEGTQRTANQEYVATRRTDSLQTTRAAE